MRRAYHVALGWWYAGWLVWAGAAAWAAEVVAGWAAAGLARHERELS